MKLREVEAENAQLKLKDTKHKLEIAQLNSLIAYLQTVVTQLQSEQQTGLLGPNWLVQVGYVC